MMLLWLSSILSLNYWKKWHSGNLGTDSCLLPHLFFLLVLIRQCLFDSHGPRILFSEMLQWNWAHFISQNWPHFVKIVPVLYFSPLDNSFIWILGFCYDNGPNGSIFYFCVKHQKFLKVNSCPQKSKTHGEQYFVLKDVKLNGLHSLNYN